MRRLICFVTVMMSVGCQSELADNVRVGLHVEATIDASGGTIDGPRGALLRVPVNAMSQEMTLVIAEAMEGFPSPSNLQLHSPVFAFLPHGTAFSEPVTVSLPTPRGDTEGYAMVTSAPDGTWMHVHPAHGVDGHLEVKVPHFSFFAVVSTDSLDVDASGIDVAENLYCGTLDRACCPMEPTCAGELVCELAECVPSCDESDCFMPECEGACRAKLEDGEVCESNDDCASRFCVDRTCCESICDGQCEACSLDGLEGSCVPVVGEPCGDRPGCGENSYDPELSPCGLQCDGINASECTPQHAGSICRSSCYGYQRPPTGVLSVCDGMGSCIEGYNFSCAPYACNDGQCNPSCLSDMECAEGALCDNSVTPGRCAYFFPYSACNPERTEHWRFTSPGHYTSYPCAPYVCDISHNGCRNCCHFDHHCAPDHVCGANERCLYRPN